MKKLFNYALLAAALLVGVNVNAVNEVSVTIDGTAQPQWTTFADAMDAVADFGTMNPTYVAGEKDDYAGKAIVITLNKDVAITKANTDYTNKYGWVIFRGQNITIDLNGYNITAEYVRFCVKQSTFSVIGKGILQNTATTLNSAGIIYAIGTNVDNHVYDTKLYIGEGATIKNPGGYGLVVLYASYCKGKESAASNTYNYGVEVTIAGTVDAFYGVANNGTANFGKPTSFENMSIPKITLTETGLIRGDDGLYEIGVLDDDEVSAFDNYYKKIHPEAQQTEIDAARAAYRTTSSGIYAPSPALWTIKGRVEGGIGIYAKAGFVTLNGATVLATSDKYYAPILYSNGFIGAGSALVFDTNSDYGTSGKAVTIENSTISSDNGFGIEEVWTKGDGVDDPTTGITIVSGVISGGNGTAITTTPETRDEIIAAGSISGGEYHGTGVEGYINPSKSQVFTYTDGAGKSYDIVFPIGENDWSQSIAEAADKEEGLKYAKVTANEDVNTNTKVEFVRIQGDAVVTVKAGKTLDAGTLMTEGANSKVIVEAGGTLIISGKQGAYTYNENSLVVKASQELSGQVLINPAVALNTTPKATIEFVSGSYYKNSIYVIQYFGAPMLAGSVKSVTTTGSANCAMKVNKGGSNWESIGTIIDGVNTLNPAKFDMPFGFYSIQSKNEDTNPQTYVFKGEIFGNTSPKIDFEKGWPGFSNAYMANTNVSAFFDVLFDQTEDPNIYTYNQVGQDKLVWTANNPLDWSVKELKPMNAFMLRNTNAKQQLALDYTSMVWDPSQNPKKAPRVSNVEKASIFVKDANGVYDKLTIAQDDQFSAAYDKGFDAEKFMNTELNLYVKDEKNLAIAATNNLDNTIVGFSCENAGKYTISFENVTGNFALVDNKTNARIEMNEGTTYEFLAEAGEDAYRFMIVRGAQAPTAMQKTNAAVKANKALVNGQIVISNGERFFNVLGTEVK